MSNLNRQFLFRKHHVGQSKAKVWFFPDLLMRCAGVETLACEYVTNVYVSLFMSYFRDCKLNRNKTIFEEADSAFHPR